MGLACKTNSGAVSAHFQSTEASAEFLPHPEEHLSLKSPYLCSTSDCPDLSDMCQKRALTQQNEISEEECRSHHQGYDHMIYTHLKTKPHPASEGLLSRKFRSIYFVHTYPIWLPKVKSLFTLVRTRARNLKLFFTNHSVFPY